MLHDCLKPFHRLLIAVVCSLVAVLLTFLVITFRDLKFYALLTVALAVFLLVIFILFVNRYRWMAHSILGALIAYGYLSKSLRLSVYAGDNIGLILFYEGSNWIEPFSLTICFIVLLLFDFFDRHPDILKLNKTKYSTPVSLKNVNANNLSISNIPSQTINQGLTTELLDHLLDREFTHGQMYTLSASAGINSQECHPLSTDVNVSSIVAELMNLLQRVGNNLKKLEHKNAIALRDKFVTLLYLNENALDKKLLQYFFTELADIEIKIVLYNHEYHKKPEDYSMVEKYIQKAHYYEKKQ